VIGVEPTLASHGIVGSRSEWLEFIRPWNRGGARLDLRASPRAVVAADEAGVDPRTERDGILAGQIERPIVGIDGLGAA